MSSVYSSYIRKKSIERFKKAEKGEETDGVKVNVPDNFKLEYTFENFVVGSSNKLAHAVALAVAVTFAVIFDNVVDAEVALANVPLVVVHVLIMFSTKPSANIKR